MPYVFKVFLQILLKAYFTVLRCMYLLENKLEEREKYSVHICKIIWLVEIDEFMKWKIQYEFCCYMPVMKTLTSSFSINWSFLKTYLSDESAGTCTPVVLSSGRTIDRWAR